MKNWLGWAIGLTLAGTTPAFADSWAVLVGIDDYVKDSIPDLRYASADAKLLGAALRELLQVPTENCFIFTSDQSLANQTPTLTNILYRLDWLQKRVKPGDTVILFFAGHGATVDGQSFLLTEESDNRSLTTLKVSSLQTRDLDELLGKMPASQVMVIVDACRNDPSGATSSGRVVSSRFEETVRLQSCSLFSCKVGERSWEWPEKKHGFFSYFLAEGMRGAAADSQGVVGLTALTQYLGNKVSTEAERVAKVKQTPWLRYEGPVDANWRLGRVAATAKSASVASLDQSVAARDQSAARIVDLQSRVQLEETRRRELEVKLADLEKRSSAPNTEEVQKLTVSRDLALKELLETQKQLEQTRRQLLDRGGVAGAELNLMLAERDQLKAENRVLAARIDLLESKLKATGVSLARSFTIDGPVQGEVEWREAEQLAQAQPSGENQLSAREAEVKVLVSQAGLRRSYADELARDWEVALTRMGALLAQSEAEKLALLQRQEELELERAVFRLQQEQAQNYLQGRAKSWEQLAVERERLREAWQLFAQRPEFRRRAISQRYFMVNSAAGLGDILDIPIKVEEATDLEGN